WFRRFTVYWAGITIGPVLLGISIALTAALQSNVAVKWVQSYVPFFKEALSILIPLLFAWGAFTLLYLYMPNTTVRLISALVGGVIAGTLWQTSIWGYSIYASSAIKWESIFGALGAIPLLLIWFYINWVIVLFGAEISFANQNAGTYRKEEASQSASPHFREIATLGIMTRIGRHHVQGMGPPSAVTLAQETRSPVRLVQDILYLLTKYGLVMEAAGTERSPGYVPARPLEQIGTQEVVNVVRHHAPMHLPLPAGEETAVVSNLVDQGDQAREEVFAPVSMAQLITEVGPSEEGEAPVESDSPMPMDGWPDDAEMADGLTHPADPTEIMPHEGEADPEEPGHPPSQDTDTTNT
ncbi:MAG: YihY family inner membrane protein, partial [Planctomycetota bacterium]|nr:YihY family inner membrane protein [Planctomycetota bacterium]